LEDFSGYEKMREQVKSAVSSLRAEIDNAFHEKGDLAIDANPDRLLKYLLYLKDTEIIEKNDEIRHLNSKFEQLGRYVCNNLSKKSDFFLSDAVFIMDADDIILWVQMNGKHSVKTAFLNESDAERQFLELIPELANGSRELAYGSCNLGNYVAYTRDVSSDIVMAAMFLFNNYKKFSASEISMVRILSEIIFRIA
jgi:hypothetical protein